MAPVLEARNVTKRFPGVLANDRIDFSLNQGEVLAFLGENGAGKSTLMNILYGLYSPDEGEVFLNGQQIEMDIGEARVRVQGLETTTTVLFGEEDAPALLGAMTLEGLLLGVDPFNRRLVPVEGLLMSQTSC